MADDASDTDLRQRAVTPAGWFPALADAPVLRAVFSMSKSLGMWMATLVLYVRLQTRLSSATGGWLDLAALDFFGLRLRRRAGQSDAALRARILAELLRPRVTREAMRRLLLDLTGREPRIFVPGHPGDALGWDVPQWGWDTTGGWGSLDMPGSVFIDVYRSITTGVPRIPGWDISAGGWDQSVASWISEEQAADAITDDDILQAMLANVAEGITIWTKIQS